MEKVEVLLVWQEIPENIKIYHLFLEPKVFALLAQCHNQYVGLDDFSEEIEDWLVKFMNSMPQRKHEVLFNGDERGQKVIGMFAETPDDGINIIVSGQML